MEYQFKVGVRASREFMCKSIEYPHKYSITCLCVRIYLFQVQCDSHIVVLHSILDRGTLPPTVGPIYGIFYGMSLCGGVGGEKQGE